MALPAGRYGLPKRLLNKLLGLPSSSEIEEKVTDIYGVMGNNGAKNLLPLKLSAIKSFNTDGIWSGNAYTYHSVTFTVNATNDLVDSIVVNGTASAQTNFWITSSAIFSSFDSDTTLSGLPSGASATTFRYGGTSIGAAYSDFKITANTNFTVAIVILSGYVANNLTFYPMIRLASDTDSTYQPYAMTNRQLTTSKANASALGTVENDDTASKAYAIGEHFSRFGDFCTVTQAIASGGTLTEGTNYVVGSIGDELSKNPISTTITATSSNISISSSYNKVYKVGNVVSFKIRITVNTAITNDADETLFSVPYTPVLTNQVFQVISVNAPWADAGFGAYLTTSKNMIVKANISTGSYDIQGVYVTTD